MLFILIAISILSVDEDYSNILLETSKILYNRAVIYNKNTVSKIILEKYPRLVLFYYNDNHIL